MLRHENLEKKLVINKFYNRTFKIHEKLKFEILS